MIECAVCSNSLLDVDLDEGICTLCVYKGHVIGDPKINPNDRPKKTSTDDDADDWSLTTKGSDSHAVNIIDNHSPTRI